jgi:hypothetical protein
MPAMVDLQPPQMPVSQLKNSQTCAKFSKSGSPDLKARPTCEEGGGSNPKKEPREKNCI